MKPLPRNGEAIITIENGVVTRWENVVRCRDCRHRDPEDHKCDCGEMERQGCPFLVDDDYFCKYGERKGGGGDE